MLNEQEKQSLLQLLDLANKAAGLQVAESCLYFAKKFELGQKPEIKEEKDADKKNKERL